jgi:Fe-S oxidoreductase
MPTWERDQRNFGHNAPAISAMLEYNSQYINTPKVYFLGCRKVGCRNRTNVSQRVVKRLNIQGVPVVIPGKIVRAGSIIW